MITEESIKQDMQMLAACAKRDAQRRQQARADAAQWAGQDYWQAMGLAARHAAQMGQIIMPPEERESEPAVSEPQETEPVMIVPRPRGRPRKQAN